MQPIFLHIFYSIPHSAAVQAKTSCRTKFSDAAGRKKSSVEISPSKGFLIVSYTLSAASLRGGAPPSRVRNRHTDILIVINNVCQRADFSHRQFRFLRCGNLCTSRVYKMRFDLFNFLKLGKQLCRQWNSAAAADSHNQSFFINAPFLQAC